MPNPYQAEQDAAIRAVRLADHVCADVRARLVDADSVTKGDKSPVTIADFGAQALVLRELALAYPDVPVVAEEDASDLLGDEAADLRQRVLEAVNAVSPGVADDEWIAAIGRGQHAGGASGRFWTLDPIDGTKGFLRNDQYAVALALIEDGEPVLGVLGCPALPQDWRATDGPTGCLLVAAKGQGIALLDLHGDPLGPVEVSRQDDLSGSTFCESVESGHSRHDWAEGVARALGITAPSVRMDSQCKYAAIARGDADIYLRLPTRPGYQEKIWDHAAGALCVTEAGGRVTDIAGAPLDFSQGRTLARNRGVVATNGLNHETVVAAVKAHAPAEVA